MEILLNDLVTAYDVLEKIDITDNVEFSYEISKLVLQMKPEFEAIRKLTIPPLKYNEYEQKLKELLAKNPNDIEAQAQLYNEYKDIIDEYQSRVRQVDELLATKKVEIKVPPPFKLSKLPKSLTTKQIRTLITLNLIQEDNNDANN